MSPVRARSLAPVLLATRGSSVAGLLIRFVVRERLVGDDREGVFHSRQDLQLLGDDIGLAELAFDHDEDRLHASRSPLAVSRRRQPPANLTGRARKAGRWSPNPSTRRSSWSSRW